MNKRPIEDAATSSDTKKLCMSQATDVAAPASFDLKMKMLRALNVINVEIMNRLPEAQICDVGITFEIKGLVKISFDGESLEMRQDAFTSTVDIASAFSKNQFRPTTTGVDMAIHLNKLEEVLNHGTATSMAILEETKNSLEVIQTNLGNAEQTFISTDQIDACLKKHGFLFDGQNIAKYQFKPPNKLSHPRISFEFDVTALGLESQVIDACLNALHQIYIGWCKQHTWLSTIPSPALGFKDDRQKLFLQSSSSAHVIIGSQTSGSYALKMYNTAGVSIGFSESPVDAQRYNENIPWVVLYNITTGNIAVNAKFASQVRSADHSEPKEISKAQALVQYIDGAVTFGVKDKCGPTVKELHVGVNFPRDTILYPFVEIDARMTTSRRHTIRFVNPFTYVDFHGFQSRASH